MSLELNDLVELKLTQNVTVNLNNTMTTAEIQAVIDAQTRDLNGYTMTFQFADGTYTLTEALTFQGFIGGTLFIYGNINEANATVLHTTQSVFLDFNTAVSPHGVYLYGTNALVVVRNLKIRVSDATNRYGIYLQSNGGMVFMYYNYIYSTSNVNTNNGVYSYLSNGQVVSTYFSNLYRGIYTNVNANMSAYNVSNTGTACKYGLFAVNASLIGKHSTQLTGCTVSNESVSTGAKIF